MINTLLKSDIQILLLGGPDEKERNETLQSKFPSITNTVCDNSLIDFAAIVNICDLIITCDYLALHIATALDKKIVVLFGPTSKAEIELYGKGVKLGSSEPCKCFYSRICSQEESCMSKITAEDVYRAINMLLGKSNN